MSFDIISAAGIDTFAFSIDEHPMWVYAVDGHYIEPLKVDVLTVANGDRYSVFVEVGKEGNYGIRVASVSLTQLIDTTAILSYEKDQNYTHYMNTTSSDHITSTPHILRNGRPASPNVTVFDQGQMVSFPPEYPTTAPEIAQTIFLTMGSVGNSYIWALNSTPFMHSTLDDTSPPLLYDSPSHLNPGGNVTITTQNNTWIDLVFLNPLLSQPPHPIHKHANPAFILGAGEGDWTWSTVAEAAEAVPENFNLVTPPYRDGFVTPVSRLLPTWLAVRYHVVNPGAWLLHCHVQSHLSGGMAVVILDGVDEWPVVPEQ
jgi:FtsP/CotA-like multicopper oxidase with cupredoxin domain